MLSGVAMRVRCEPLRQIDIGGQLVVSEGREHFHGCSAHPCFEPRGEILCALGWDNVLHPAIASVTHPGHETAALEAIDELGGAAQADALRLGDLAHAHDIAEEQTPDHL